MKINKTFISIFYTFLLVSCGSGGDADKNTQYYKKQDTETKKLELEALPQALFKGQYPHPTLPFP